MFLIDGLQVLAELTLVVGVDFRQAGNSRDLVIYCSSVAAGFKAVLVDGFMIVCPLGEKLKWQQKSVKHESLQISELLDGAQPFVGPSDESLRQGMRPD